MKKLLIAATVVLVSSSPLVLLPMEKELTLTQKQVQKLTQNTTASLAQFKQIPKNPRTITTILTYKNKDLTEFKTSIVLNPLRLAKQLRRMQGPTIW